MASLKQLEKLKTDVKNLFAKNRRTKDGFQYTVPSPKDYPYQWLWDSCFHAIILCRINAQDAKQELLSVVAKQLPNGLLPHMIYWERGEAHNIKWGLEQTSSITQPPVIALAVERIFKSDGDKQFLTKIYPNLYHYYKYLLNERDPHENHLIGIINPDESGEDDSPRFDRCLGLAPQQTLEENFAKRLELVDKNLACNFDAPFCMRNFFWVKDVPFNAIMVAGLNSLATLAEALGFEEDAIYFKQESLKIAASMRERMLAGGIFWPTYGQDYQKIKVKTWAMFAPLIAQILSQEEAKTLVDHHLQNPKEFKAKFSVPTVSQDEPSYNPSGFWRGPAWMATNWFVYQGLINYGFVKEAEKIREDSLVLIEQSGFRERFNPETGEGLGASDFTWGGLVLDMFSDLLKI